MNLKQFYTGRAIGFIIVIAIVLCIFAVWKLHAPTSAPAAQTPEHTWAPFENYVLGITLEYPADILTPVQGATATTTSIEFPYTGKTTEGNVQDGIRIGTEDTNAKNIAEYFATPGIQTPVPPTPITIGGLPAMELDEMAYADYQIYLIRGGKLYVITINLPAAEAQYVKSSIAFESDLSAYVGSITTNANGSHTYMSPKYGITLDYPKGWYVGDNHLGYGTFQIFNYDPAQDNLPIDTAKIEMGVGVQTTYGTPTDDIDTSQSSSQHITVAGQNALVTQTTYKDGKKIITYSIQLPHTTDTYFTLTAYGDPLSFKVLDGIVKSITWK